MNNKITFIAGLFIGAFVTLISMILIEGHQKRTIDHNKNTNQAILQGSHDGVNYENISSNYRIVLEVSSTGKIWKSITVNEELPDYSYKGNGYYRLKFIPKP